jgi:hypothetical protein
MTLRLTKNSHRCSAESLFGYVFYFDIIIIIIINFTTFKHMVYSPKTTQLIHIQCYRVVACPFALQTS